MIYFNLKQTDYLLVLRHGRWKIWQWWKNQVSFFHCRIIFVTLISTLGILLVPIVRASTQGLSPIDPWCQHAAGLQLHFGCDEVHCKFGHQILPCRWNPPKEVASWIGPSKGHEETKWRGSTLASEAGKRAPSHVRSPCVVACSETSNSRSSSGLSVLRRVTNDL